MVQRDCDGKESPKIQNSKLNIQNFTRITPFIVIQCPGKEQMNG